MDEQICKNCGRELKDHETETERCPNYVKPENEPEYWCGYKQTKFVDVKQIDLF